MLFPTLALTPAPWLVRVSTTMVVCISMAESRLLPHAKCRGVQPS